MGIRPHLRKLSENIRRIQSAQKIKDCPALVNKNLK